MTAARREMKVTPSQASKALARLKAHYRVKLLTRGPNGMALTEAGREVMPNVQAAGKALTVTSKVVTDDVARELTIAGPSYLVGIAVAAIAATQPELRLRGLELAIRARCVAYGPWIAARRHLRTGKLVEIPVAGWAQVDSLELLCNGDLIRDRMRRQLVATLREELTGG